ncbi:phosphopantothenate-cysteine ligase [Fomitiporia mediterranea MF3/22]|uniref:phosphopantothenate-cysteine ligase n=1 Tax=Fomitiporia mediterranea (strain MF3/22) TaxID=694068 RepID=UPI0004408EBD|nr:phosphopantothenate-cysteine ligase [Fomitiporia mediterranea MF3/22]EJC99315.1 phosphopantothenate-cysteine ligase [Fomitiporia mediterranea MF3/22]
MSSTVNPLPSTSNKPFSAETYFATQPPPATLDSDISHTRAFIARHAVAGRKVVLVTSGGTTVPLELNVVRFLDNFSAGTRGATSAEYFLRAGYAVIFMHRQHSLQPYSRHYSHSTNPFLDFLELEDPPNSSPSSVPAITVRSADPEHLRSVLSAYKAVHKSGTLHTLTFVTVNEYLWLLRAVSKELSVLGRNAMYYLAAAVSDFFLPREKMSEHKIQSGKGSLVIEMDQVPKILKPMVDEWTPEGFIVSFKARILETDLTLLVPKARAALERYGHQVVIGNELHTRKYEVVFVARTASSPSSASTSTPDGINSRSTNIEETWLRITEQASHMGKEIEEDIVDELVRRHISWIRSANT